MKVFAKSNPKSGGGNFRKTFCPGCFYLGKRTNAQINYKHAPSACPRSTALVAMIEAEEHETENSGSSIRLIHSLQTLSQQTVSNAAGTATEQDPKDQVCQPVSKVNHVFMNKSKLQSLILHLKANVQKALSPALNVSLNGHGFLAIIDEGSELNCLDSKLIETVGIPIHVSDLGAKSAGNFKMKIVGPSKNEVVVSVVSSKMQGKINLGVCVVIENLGVDMLIGQPAKIKHEIVTKPHLQRVSFRDTHGLVQDVASTNRSSSKPSGEVVRVVKQVVLYPGEALHWVLQGPLKTKKRVMFSPRIKLSQSGFAPKVLKVAKDASIEIVNGGDDVIHLNKHDHVGDVREAISFEEALISKLYTLDKNDFTKPLTSLKAEETACHIADVVIDPDNIMESKWKSKFAGLCQDFSDIIQYRPGTYNGYFGYLQNTIEFASIPPPNSRFYVPKYSKEQMDMLANKMDELLDLGILATPESVGVTPIFTSPSMLVPKPDPDGGWRLVTDFTQLNNYIRKMPTSTPTIEETRLIIASFKYIVCIDLSQFYFQNRVDRESTQFLGVIHPYKGTMVYTASPMGLRNSSEIAYERLKRIFGDMQMDRKLCQQADALIVGGNVIEDLFSNLAEVFKRLRECGMTIKPSKLIICPKKWFFLGGTSVIKRGVLAPTRSTLLSPLQSLLQLNSCVRGWERASNFPLACRTMG